MTDSPIDQAVIETMNDLLRASSDCAEYDPGMSAKFAATAKDLGRDLGITSSVSDGAAEADLDDEDENDDDEEFQDLLHLLHLQKKAVAAAEVEIQSKSRFGWLGLDVWSRW